MLPVAQDFSGSSLLTILKVQSHGVYPLSARRTHPRESLGWQERLVPEKWSPRNSSLLEGSAFHLLHFLRGFCTKNKSISTDAVPISSPHLKSAVPVSRKNPRTATTCPRNSNQEEPSPRQYAACDRADGCVLLATHCFADLLIHLQACRLRAVARPQNIGRFARIMRAEAGRVYSVALCPCPRPAQQPLPILHPASSCTNTHTNRTSASESSHLCSRWNLPGGTYRISGFGQDHACEPHSERAAWQEDRHHRERVWCVGTHRHWMFCRLMCVSACVQASELS